MVLMTDIATPNSSRMRTSFGALKDPQLNHQHNHNLYQHNPDTFSYSYLWFVELLPQPHHPSDKWWPDDHRERNELMKLTNRWTLALKASTLACI